MPAGDVKKGNDSTRTTFGRYLNTLKPQSVQGRNDVVLYKEQEHLRWLITYIQSRKATSSQSRKQKPVELADETASGSTPSADLNDVNPIFIAIQKEVSETILSNFLVSEYLASIRCLMFGYKQQQPLTRPKILLRPRSFISLI